MAARVFSALNWTDGTMDFYAYEDQANGDTAFIRASPSGMAASGCAGRSARRRSSASCAARTTVLPRHELPRHCAQRYLRERRGRGAGAGGDRGGAARGGAAGDLRRARAVRGPADGAADYTVAARRRTWTGRTATRPWWRPTRTRCAPRGRPGAQGGGARRRGLGRRTSRAGAAALCDDVFGATDTDTGWGAGPRRRQRLLRTSATRLPCAAPSPSPTTAALRWSCRREKRGMWMWRKARRRREGKWMCQAALEMGPRVPSHTPPAPPALFRDPRAALPARARATVEA